MGLTPEQINALLAKEINKKKSPGRKPKNAIDTSVRDYQTWFKLMHKLFDENTEDGRPRCSNPNCPDTRDPGKAKIAIVDGVDMCRICFLNGYMAPMPELEGFLDE